MSQYRKGKTNLDFSEERDIKWQWHQLGCKVCRVYAETCQSSGGSGRRSCQGNSQRPRAAVGYFPDSFFALSPRLIYRSRRKLRIPYMGHMQVCISLQTDNHASTPPLCIFTGRMPFLPPSQQRQSTENWQLPSTSTSRHRSAANASSVTLSTNVGS